MQQATIISPQAPRQVRRRLLTRRRVLGASASIAVGAAATTFGVRHVLTKGEAVRSATLHVSSEPRGAAVEIDGRTRGQTPLALPIAAGAHEVLLHYQGAIPTRAAAGVGSSGSVRLAATLWRSLPAAQPLQPPFPGMVIACADFLANGDVVLLAKPQAGSAYTLWRRRDDGSLTRLGSAAAPGRVVARPDGLAVAFLAPGTTAAPDLSGTPLTTVRTADGDGANVRRWYALSPAQPGEQLADLSWAPDARHVLLVTHRKLSGGARDRLLWLDFQAGAAQTVGELPTAIVPGSLTWGPDGATVALLTQTGPLVSLCLANVQTGAVRYLADLGQRDPAALPYPPIAWSPDGQHVVYAAGAHERASGLGGFLLGDQTVDLLYSAEARGGEGHQLDAAPSLAPVWRASGDILALSRQTGGALAIDQFTLPHGRTPAVGKLPVTPASPVAVRWDAAHARALLVQHVDAGLTGWLLSFAMEGR